MLKVSSSLDPFLDAEQYLRPDRVHLNAKGLEILGGGYNPMPRKSGLRDDNRKKEEQLLQDDQTTPDHLPRHLSLAPIARVRSKNSIFNN